MSEKLYPVFIMGAPRSGTTLLASMLSSREDIISLPEMQYIHDLLKNEVIFKRLGADYIGDFLFSHFMFRSLGLCSTRAELDALIGCTVVETIKNIIDSYNSNNSSKNYSLWVEHTPHNHKYFLVLLKQFPNAKFIHIVRDGRAVFSSMKKTDWGYRDAIKGANDWQSIVEDCLVLESMFTDKVMKVRYEDLIVSPVECMKKICGFLGVKYSESMLDGRGVSKTGLSKYAKDLGKPANTKSAHKWKDELSNKEIMHFNAINKRLLLELDYKDDVNSCNEIKGIDRIVLKIFSFIKTKYLQWRARKRFEKF